MQSMPVPTARGIVMMHRRTSDRDISGGDTLSGMSNRAGTPAEVGQLAGLRTLQLSENQLTSLPAEVGGQLAGLYKLSLWKNQLTSLPVEVQALLATGTLIILDNNPIEAEELLFGPRINQH